METKPQKRQKPGSINKNSLLIYDTVRTRNLWNRKTALMQVYLMMLLQSNVQVTSYIPYYVKLVLLHLPQ